MSPEKISAIRKYSKIRQYAMLRKYLVLLCAVFLIAGFAESSNNKDYPLIASYPDAQLDVTQFSDESTLQLPLSKINSRTTPNQFKSIEVKGSVLKYTYNIKSTSTLDVYENYINTLQNSGFKILFSCKLKTCGDQADVEALRKLIAVDSSLNSSSEKPYYLVAEKLTDKGKVYGAWFIGSANENVTVQQIILEEKSPVDNLIKNESSLSK